MPQRVRARRFASMLVVSQATVDAELPYLARDIENYLALSMTEIKEKLGERHVLARRAWDHLEQMLPALPERDMMAVRALLFRDLFHALHLYVTNLRTRTEIGAAATFSAPTTTVGSSTEDSFSEWLFGDP